MKGPRYDTWTNNCHLFVINLLNLICDLGRKKVATILHLVNPTEAGSRPMFSMLPSARTEEELMAEETMQAMMVVLGEAMKIMLEETPKIGEDEKAKAFFEKCTEPQAAMA
jgi:hypothetical protein